MDLSIFIILSVLTTMSPRKLLHVAQTAAICAQARRKKSNKEIAENTGIALKSVQRWTKVYQEGGSDAVLPPYKPAGP